MDIGALKPVDRDVEGIVEMMLDVTHYHQSLTTERLLGGMIPVSHRASGMYRIRVGAWRGDSTGTKSGGRRARLIRVSLRRYRAVPKVNSDHVFGNPTVRALAYAKPDFSKRLCHGNQ
jgi:hypothetical protein